MKARHYFAVSGVLFALVCLAHLLRILAAWPVVVDNWSVPMGLSWIGVAVTGLLAVAAFRLLAKAGS